MTQAEALAILESGQSVLLTGAAGTGKTYLINEFQWYDDTRVGWDWCS